MLLRQPGGDKLSLIGFDRVCGQFFQLADARP
jgi:hypothetical protein